MLKSKKLLLDFIKTGEINKISDFITYDFHKIREKKELKRFDNGKSYEDGDCTKLAYALYSLIWTPKMHELGISQFSETNFEKWNDSFSGDTINTLYTSLGSLRFRARILSILKFEPDEEKVFMEFQKKYQTIGNFYFLPKNTIHRESINLYKGSRWNDYFDIFLAVLNCAFADKNLVDESFSSLLEKNAFFFQKISSMDKFLDLFFLYDEQEKFNYLTDFILHGTGLHFAHSMLCANNASEYKDFVLNYMKKANVLIEKRSKVLVRVLIQNLKNNNFPEEYLN